MRVRRLTPEGAGLAAEVLRAVKGCGVDPTFGTEHLRRLLSRPENILIAAGEEGKPAGFLLAYVLDRVDRDRKMVCLYEIGVAEGFRRRGVGRALVEELKACCRREGVVKAWVIASRANTAAVRLYESSGARAAGEDDVVFVYGPPW